jgi:competence protein ComEA
VRACLAALSTLWALGATEAWAQSRPTERPRASGASPATPSTRAQPGAPTAGAAVSTEGAVNINTASEEELQRLPRVGPSRAAAIVALRARVQRFRSPDDLLRVRGIGRASLRRLRPYVTLQGETTLTSRPGRPPRTTPAALAPTSM